MKSFGVNVTSVYALRSCGLGHTGFEKLCCLMNMPCLITVSNSTKISNSLRDAAKLVAEKSMSDVVLEAKKYREEVADIGVSVDGTLHRRGYSSLNVVVIAISIDTGQIVDLEILTRYCRLCDLQSKLLKDNIESLDAWNETRNVYGDGDSKGYAEVRYTYPDKEVEKFECIGHYQKELVIVS